MDPQIIKSELASNSEVTPPGTSRERWLLVARRAWMPVAALIVWLTSFGVYLTTVAPTVLAVTGHTRDAGKFQIAAPLLGTGHPTGYPTYIMLGKLFTYLPFGDVAYRVNLMSAFFGALAAALLFLVVWELGGLPLPAAGAALILAFSATFWSQATIAEVYTMNAAFLLGVTYLLLLWRRKRRGAFLLVAALLYGISLGNHASMVLLAPAYLVLAAAGRRRELSVRLLASTATLAILGAAVYLYVPIRGFAGAWHSYRYPASTTAEVWRLVTGGSSLHARMGSGLSEMGVNLSRYAAELTNQAPGWLGWILAVLLLGLGGLGFAAMVRRDLPVGVFVLLAFGAELLYALNYRIADIAVYYIPTYLLLAVGFAIGVSTLASRSLWAGVFASMIPLLLAGAMAVTNHQHVDRSEEYGARAAAEALLKRLPPNAVVYGKQAIVPAVYLTRVEGERQDVELRWVPRNVRRIDEDIRRSLQSGQPVYLLSNPRQNDKILPAVEPYARFVPQRKLIRLLPK